MDDTEDSGFNLPFLPPVGFPTTDNFHIGTEVADSVQDVASQSEPEHIEVQEQTFDSAGWLIPTTPHVFENEDDGPEILDGQIPQDGFDETGFLKLSWAMDQSAIEGSLTALGLVGPRLAIQAGDEHVLLDQIVRHLGISMEWQQKRWHLAKLFRLVQVAVDRSSIAKRMRGDNLSSAQQILLDRMFMDRATAQRTPLIVVPSEFLIPPKGQRRSRQLAASAQVTQQEQEELDKRKYLAILIDILELCEAPLVLVASQSANPGLIIRGALGDTRVGTLRQYVKSLQAFRQWLTIGFGGVWPKLVHIFLEYLHARIEEPCAPSIPSVFAKSLAWLERVGGAIGLDRFISNPKNSSAFASRVG
jgi:hypothetical protein